MRIPVNHAAPLVALASLLVAHRLRADMPPVPEQQKFGYDFVSRLANTPLPFTNEDSVLSVDLQPKFEDLLHKDYIRLPIEITYSSTSKREINFGFIPYFENPTASEPRSSDGYLTFGVKQRIDGLPEHRLSFAVGFDARVPMEEIPTDRVRESFDSYMPYLTAAYQLDERNKWLAFTTVQYHLVGQDRRRIQDPFTEPPNLLTLRPGVIYQPGEAFRYSMQLEYKTDRVDGGSDTGLSLVPGITWYPSPTTPVFRRIVGHFELSLEFEYALSQLAEDEDEDTFGVSLQVRWRFLSRKPTMEDKVF